MTAADPGDDVRGRTVIDRAGEEIGEVDALLVDEGEEKVRFLEVAAGGFLGLGERKFLIPVDAVTRIDAKQVHVDQERQRIVGAPAYDPAVTQRPDYDEDIVGYDGYTPFWGPGYVDSGDPYLV